MFDIHINRLLRGRRIPGDKDKDAGQDSQTVRARLDAILEDSEDGIISKDLNGIITGWNRGAERIYGYRADEAIGQPISMLMPHGQEREAADILDRIKHDERVVHQEMQRIGKDGAIRDISLTVSPLKDTTGRVVSALIVARDLSRCRQTEQMLQDSEARFRSLIETAPLGIAMVNLHGMITLVNDRLTALFGYTPDELLGQPVEMLIPESLRAAHSLHRGEYAAAPSMRPIEGRNLAARRKDGTDFPVEIGLSPFRTAEQLSVVAFISDISERARLYDEIKAHAETLEKKVAERTGELQEALEHVQSADRAKTMMLATVSHEMRTPLSTVLGFSNLMLHRTLSEETTLAYARAINDEGRRLAALIDDFLDLQRIEMGRQEFQLTAVDVAELVREEVAERHFDEPQARRIRVDSQAVPRVRADLRRIRQVIRNLLSNALKFCPEGEITLSIWADAREVNFAIHDQGIGITADELSELFHHFFRGQAAEERRIPGTGLGLALCREIIVAHQGRIWAESPGLNQGATFRFALPIEGPLDRP